MTGTAVRIVSGWFAPRLLVAAWWLAANCAPAADFPQTSPPPPASAPTTGTTSATAPAATAPVTGAATPTPSSTAAPPAVNYFDVHEYRVLGNTVLENRDIETVLYPLLGDHKTLADVESARTALEKYYHDRGFGTVFVDIPEQDVDDKIVRLKVTEGRLREVHIQGARYFSERKILAAVPAAAAGTVPNLPELQTQLSAVGVQTADRTVVPILKAGAEPGTVDLTLKVDDHLPVHGSLEFDNQNTPGTHELRATATVGYGNLFQDLDNFSLQYQFAPQDVSQVSVVAANYAWGAVGTGFHPSMYFIESDSNVPTVGTLGVIGKGQIFGARLGYSVFDSATAPQVITLGIDYKHFLQSIGLASTAGLNTPITYTNFSVAYSGNWSSNWLSGSLGSAANFGARGDPNDPDTFANKRFEGHPNYFYVKLDGSLVAQLPRGFKIILRADGQFAEEPLITNEDFSLTGADGVRGYLEAEVLADKGLKGGIQFQSPNLVVRGFNWGDGFIFFDGGRASVIDPQGEQGSTKLSSFGAGLTLLPAYWLNALLTWAIPLDTGPNTRSHDGRLLFVVRGSF
jgi:hemolysin activation/secretion protein